jgi:hypothetical protein
VTRAHFLRHRRIGVVRSGAADFVECGGRQSGLTRDQYAIWKKALGLLKYPGLFCRQLRADYGIVYILVNILLDGFLKASFLSSARRF